METLYADLTSAAQTGYAQLLDAAVASDHVRSVSDLPGSFAAKTVKGRKYWYFQYTEPAGKLRQVYVGPDSEPVQRLMALKKSQPATTAALEPLARSAIALGCTPMVPRQYRVVRRLADYGFFRAGGVLIGTHAFLAHGNMLGVRWGASDRTQDMDFAHAGKSVSLALPSNIEVRTEDAIESLQMGFLPAAGLSGTPGGTYLIPKEPEFRLDFLTPLHRGRDTPFAHPKLGITLQPLRFVEFSLQNIEQAALFCPEGAVLVNVPDPARFAVHKLLVAGDRKGAFATKSSKDLAQSAALLQYLSAHRPHQLDEAYADARARGKGWSSRLDTGVALFTRRFPDHPALDMLAGPS
jgi:hypothetical protein